MSDIRGLLKRVVSLSAAVALLGSCIAGRIQAEEAVYSNIGDGFEKALENSDYILCYNPATAEIALNDLRNERVWYSNPQDRSSDASAGENAAAQLSSQFFLDYIDVNGNKQSVNSYSYCTSLNQHAYRIKDGNLTVTYKMSNSQFSNEILPAIISEKSMEKVFSKLSETEISDIREYYNYYAKSEIDEKEVLEQITLNFPSINKHNIYVRQEFPEYIGEELYRLFQKAGYTLESLENDCKDNDIKMTYEEPFSAVVSLVYSVTEQGFSAEIKADSITCSKGQPITGLTLLPFFGAGSSTDEGYVFVPDGSGALIDFNNGKTGTSAYRKTFFEDDRTVLKTELPADGEYSVLPVFGIENNKKAFVASIDSGYECSGITADISGKTSSYNYAAPFFNLRTYDTVSMGIENASDSTVTRFQNTPFSGDIVINYLFLTEDDGAGYSGMAVKYRNYLVKLGILKQKEITPNTLNISFTATAMEKKKFLFFQYNSPSCITSFDDMEEILKELDSKNIDVKIQNAVNGGSKQTSAENIKLIGGIGGMKAYNSLSELVHSISLSINFTSASNTPKSVTALNLQKSMARIYSYDPVSRYYIFKQPIANVISPACYVSIGEKLIKSMNKKKINSICFNDIGYVLNSDFNQRNECDRNEARKQVQKVLSSLEKSFEISAQCGSVYSIPYLDKIWDIPSRSSGIDIENRSVPFVAMVLHGFVPYCTKPVNTDADLNHALLNAVENGAQLQFSWIRKLPENALNASESFYNLQYSNSIKQAKSFSKRLEPIEKAVYSAHIIKHEYLSDNLRSVLYDNGVRVYINYGSEDITTDDGTVVKSQSFELGAGQ